jgi:carbon storage regulator
MLVLTRRLGEKVIIDGNIVVTVVAVEGTHVRLGIDAPPHVRVDRKEIHERRHRPAAERDGCQEPYKVIA